MRVLFVCSGGMSSAIIVEVLKEEAQSHHLQMEVLAVGAEQFTEEIENGWDIAMVAPQVRHRLASFKSIADQVGVICEVIPLEAYSPLSGSLLLQKIQKLLGHID